MTPFKLAERFVGIKEVPGTEDNPQIMAMLKLYDEWPEHDEVPWCSAFVNYIAWLLRLPRSKSLMARSWLDVGVPVWPPEVGFDVIVLSRESTNPKAGHVGFFAGIDKKYVWLLGGNQSNTVSISAYDRYRLLGARRLGTHEI